MDEHISDLQFESSLFLLLCRESVVAFVSVAGTPHPSLYSESLPLTQPLGTGAGNLSVFLHLPSFSEFDDADLIISKIFVSWTKFSSEMNL